MGQRSLAIVDKVGQSAQVMVVPGMRSDIVEGFLSTLSDPIRSIEDEVGSSSRQRKSRVNLDEAAFQEVSAWHHDKTQLDRQSP